MVKQDRFLTIGEAAEFLKVSKTSLRRWSKDGRIRCYRLGQRGERRFREADLLSFVYGSEQSITPEKAHLNQFDPHQSKLPLQMQPPRHICSIYTDDEDQWRQIRPFLLDHIHHNGRVLYAYRHDPGKILDRLAAENLDGQALCAQGRLIVMPYSDACLLGDNFDIDRLLIHFAGTLEELCAQTSEKFLLIGETSECANAFPDYPRLLEYEARLNALLQNFPQVTVICQYSLVETPAVLIFENLCLHPYVQSHDELVEGLNVHPNLLGLSA